MKLQMYPNGTGEGENTYVSLYCFLIPGKNDDHLKWPFKGTVYITLLNQMDDSEHFSKELVWSPSNVVPDEVAKKPDAIAKNKGWGFEKFFLISEVEDFTTTKQYLMNDTLVFKISVSV